MTGSNINILLWPSSTPFLGNRLTLFKFNFFFNFLVLNIKKSLFSIFSPFIFAFRAVPACGNRVNWNSYTFEMEPPNLAFWILAFNHTSWKQQSSFRFAKTIFFVLERVLCKLTVLLIVIFLDYGLDFWVNMSLPSFVSFCAWFEHMLSSNLLFQIGSS